MVKYIPEVPVARISRSDLLVETGILATGFALGAVAAFLLPFLCFFAVPIFFGWFAGGGTTQRAFLYPRAAAALGIGAIGAVTVVMTFTLGWHRSHQEWILYSAASMSVFFWGSYIGMRWLHSASDRSLPGNR